jgi:uncharacterized caspase-like protein
MLRRLLGRGLGLLAGAVMTASMGALAATPAFAETRVALVLGAGNYSTNPVPGALNDAGLIARTLTDLGFSTVQGADLTGAELRQAIAEFMGKLREAGPDSVAIVYLSGVGLQHDSDSYLIPADTVVERESDVPIGGLRLADLTRALAAVPSKAKVVLLDMSHQHPFTNVGRPVAPGLGILDGAPGMLIASAAAPGQLTTPSDQPYGRFAQALAEQLSAPGIPLDEAVARARLRVHQLTQGRDTPWEVSQLQQPAPILNAGETTGSTPPPPPPLAERPTEGLSPQEAYALAIERNSIAGYQAFLRAYPDDPLAQRVRRLLANAREAQVWRRTIRNGSPEAYWTYLRHYPRGPHADEARWRLERLSASFSPPPAFAEVVYDDLPPPLPVVEVVYDPLYWEPAPPAFYDGYFIGNEVYLGPPVAPVYLLPPPPSPMWGVLPVVGVAALVAAPIVIQRFVRPRAAPVVLTPRAGPRFGAPPGVRPGGFPGGQGGQGFRPLPGGPGGGALPGARIAPGQGPGQIAPGARIAPGANPMLNRAPGAGPGLNNRGLGGPGPQGQGLVGRPAGRQGLAGRGPGDGFDPRVGNRGNRGQNFAPGFRGPRGGGGPSNVRVQPQMQPRIQQARPNFQPRIQQAPRVQQARPSFQAPRQSFQAPRQSFQAPRVQAPRAAPSGNNNRRRFP